MVQENNFLRECSAKLLAIAIILSLYGFARLPTLDESQRQQMAGRFAFTKVLLPEAEGFQQKFIRNVNPSLEHHSAWISAVGAAVSLNDLDGDGLANDLCQVDTRIDQVVIAPAPGTGNRYPLTVLSPSPLPYNEKTMAPMGCLPADMNEDGRMDLLVYYWGRTPVLFLNNGNGYDRQELVNNQERWFTNAATFADMDGDGHADLIVANYFQDGAHILDADAKEPDQMQHSMSRAYNGGGKHFFLWQSVENSSNQAAVHFSEVTNLIDKEVNYGWTLALGAQDLDGDMLPELYFANDFGPDRLLHNRSQPGKLAFALLEGKRDFTMPASKVLGKDSFKGMGVDFSDLNGDEMPDLFISNIAAEYSLQESHFLYVSTGDKTVMKQGVAPYKDRSEPMGVARSFWSWDTKFADFDNDGRVEALQASGFLKGEVNRWPELQELAIGNDENMAGHNVWPYFKMGDDLSGHTHNPFYVMDKTGRFYDLSAEIGIDQNQISRGIAIADIDGDGDQDFAVANQWEPSFLFRNECLECKKNFIGLHLRLPVNGGSEKTRVYDGHPSGLSRPAIGASAKVLFPDGEFAVAQVDGGNGHSGKRSHDLHFGLGKLAGKKPMKVQLHWRDSKGRIHKETVRLTSGWHTIELADTIP